MHQHYLDKTHTNTHTHTHTVDSNDSKWIESALSVRRCPAPATLLLLLQLITQLPTTYYLLRTPNIMPIEKLTFYSLALPLLTTLLFYSAAEAYQTIRIIQLIPMNFFFLLPCFFFFLSLDSEILTITQEWKVVNISFWFGIKKVCIPNTKNWIDDIFQIFNSSSRSN